MKQTWDMALPKFVGTLCGTIVQNSDEPQIQLDLWLRVLPIIWVWVNTYRYIFRGMNIHLPAILMWTTGVQGFDTLPYWLQWPSQNLHWKFLAQHAPPVVGPFESLNGAELLVLLVLLVPKYALWLLQCDQHGSLASSAWYGFVWQRYACENSGFISASSWVTRGGAGCWMVKGQAWGGWRGPGCLPNYWWEYQSNIHGISVWKLNINTSVISD